MIELHCRPPHELPTRVQIECGLRRSLAAAAAGRNAFALVDAVVAERHPEAIAREWTTLHVRGGESLKTLDQAELVLRAMAEAGLDRGGLLLAIGGGTVGDLGGLCAALWLRGIECWQVPTTMMAMVDSAVGGKTAVNLPEGKNLVGVVHPPARVLVDPDFVVDLPPIDYASGLAEALKVAIGLDDVLFGFLEQNASAVLARDLGAVERVVQRCLAAKAAVVESDLRETGPRRVLNLGHTLGHALEANSGFAVPHGLCVARGLHFALDVAVAEGQLGKADADRCTKLLLRYGYARDPLPPTAELLPFVARDKKAEHGTVRFVVPTGIGRAGIRPLRLEQIGAAIDRHRAG